MRSETGIHRHIHTCEYTRMHTWHTHTFVLGFPSKGIVLHTFSYNLGVSTSRYVVNFLLGQYVNICFLLILQLV